MWDAHGEAGVVGIQDLQRQSRGDFFAESILSFQDSAVGTSTEFEG